MSAPDAYICHRTENRLRIRIPSKRGDNDFFDEVRDLLSQIEGIERVEINLTTGSVLLVHNLDPETMEQYATLASPFFNLKMPDSQGVPIVYRTMVYPLGDINQRVKDFTEGEIDIPSLAFLGLMSVGIYQISIGNFMAPAWYTAFWFATNTIWQTMPGKKQDGR